MKKLVHKDKPRSGGMSAKVFRECVRNMREVSLMQTDERPPLLPGWTWAITYPGGDLGNPKLAAQLLSQDFDCMVYVLPDGPGKSTLGISTGVAPAEVVAAVLKANRIL